MDEEIQKIDEATKVSFDGSLTYDDLKRLENISIPFSRKVLLVIVCAGALLYGVYDGISDTDAPLLPAIGISIFVIGMILFFLWLFTFIGSKWSRSRYEKNRVYCKGTISEENLTVKDEKASSSLEWSFFKSYTHKESIIALHSDYQTFGFAPYLFRSDKDWQKALEIIKNKLPEKCPKKDIENK